MQMQKLFHAAYFSLASPSEQQALFPSQARRKVVQLRTLNLSLRVLRKSELRHLAPVSQKRLPRSGVHRCPQLSLNLHGELGFGVQPNA